ncbi:MAG: hypothetical protein ACE15C_04545 [Phycisphaerae bacterium]
MNLAVPTILWLAAGLPVAAPFIRRGRWDIGLFLLPFGGCLALIAPWIVSALAGTSAGGWWWIVEAAVAGAVMGAVAELILRVGKPRRGKPASGSLPMTGASLPRLSSPVRTLRRVLIPVSLLIVAFVAWSNFTTGLGFCRGYPPYQWDGYAIWLLRAKMLAGASAYPTAVWTGTGHFDYPLVLPALLALFRRFGGLEILGLSSAIGLNAGVFPLAAWAGMFRRIGGGLAGAVALAPFAMDRLLRLQFAAFADPLLTMAGLYGLSLCLIGVRDRDRGYLLAGGLALAVAAATKNEGVLWVLCCGPTVGLYVLDTRQGFRKAVGAVLCAVLPAAVFFAAWGAAWRRIGVSNDLVTAWTASLMSVRLGPVLTAVWTELAKPANLLLLGVGLAGMLALPVVWRAGNVLMGGSQAVRGGTWGEILRTGLLCLRRTLVLLSGPALYVAGIVLIYLTTHNPLEWHLRTSLDRVLFLAPPAVLAMMLIARVGAPGEPAPAPAWATGGEEAAKHAGGQH